MRSRTQVLFLAFLTTLGACTDPTPPATASAEEAPLLFVAIDGLDWRVVQDLVREKRLPTFQRLMEEGTVARLQPFLPAEAPVLWTSLATVAGPSQHGIASGRVQEDDRVRPASRADVRAEFLWERLSNAGRRVSCLGWPLTAPVRSLNGGILAHATSKAETLDGYRGDLWYMAFEPGVDDLVWPEPFDEWAQGESRRIEEGFANHVEEVFGTFPHPLEPLETRLWNESAWVLKADELVLRGAGHVLASIDVPEALFLYLNGVDVLGHRFWRHAYAMFFDPRPGGKQLENLRNVIGRYHEYLDRRLGALIESYETHPDVVIASTCGMVRAPAERVYREDRHVRSLHSATHANAPLGLLIAAGPGIRGTARPRPLDDLREGDLPILGSIVDVGATITRRFGLPLPFEETGRTLPLFVGLDPMIGPPR